MSNIAGHLVNAKDFIQERAINNFTQVSAEFGQQLRDAIKLNKSAKM